MQKACSVFLSKSGAHMAGLLVYIAKFPDERARGLSKIAELPAGQGMLFKPAATFWMKDTLIPLDLCFVDAEGKILDIVTMPVPEGGKPLITYACRVGQPAYAVEANAGFFASHRITPGDTCFLMEPASQQATRGKTHILVER
jgi:uncharacterized protein